MNLKDIEQYLTEVKHAVEEERYRIDRNYKRQANRELFLNYVIDERRAKEILLGLSPRDFSEMVQNQHERYGWEELYIFGREVLLLERYGTKEKIVPLYIKINKLPDRFVIVISFHEQKYPLKYYFK